MSVIRNPDKQLIFRCWLGAIAGFLILGGVFVNYRRQLKNYVKTEAVLEGIIKEHGQTEETALNLFSYAVYSYSYEGKEYIGKRQLLFSAGKTAGEQEVILINPNQPETIEDTLFQKILLLATAGCLLFLCIEFPTAIAYLRR